MLRVPFCAAARERARVRIRARAAGARAAPARAGAAAAARGRARDRALPPVRGGRRAAERDVGARRPCCWCSTTCSGPTGPTLLLLRHLRARPDHGRVLVLGAYRSTEARLGGFADALAELRRERLVTQIEVLGLERGRDRRAGSAPRRRRPSRVVLQRAARGDRGQPVLRRGDRAPPLGGRCRRRARRRAELERVGLPEGVKDVIARRLRTSRRPGDRVAPRRGGDRARLRRRARRTRRRPRRGRVSQRARRGTRRGADRRGPARRPLQLLPRTDPGDTVRGHVGAATRPDSPAGGGGARGGGRRSQPDGARVALRPRRRGAGRGEGDRVRVRAREQATAMLAHEDAVDHYVTALEVQVERFMPEALTRRCELLLALGEARVRAGERPLAWSASARRLRWQPSSATAVGSRAALGASRRYIQPPGVVDEELIGMVQQALEVTPESGRCGAWLCWRDCAGRCTTRRARAHAGAGAEATDIAQELGDPESRSLAAAARRRAFWDPRRLEQRLADSTELLTLARESGDLELVLQGHALARPRPARARRRRRRRRPDRGLRRRRGEAAPAALSLERRRVARDAGAAGRAAEGGRRARRRGAGDGVLSRDDHRPAVLRDSAAGDPPRAGSDGRARAARPRVPGANRRPPAWRAALATLLWETGRREEARAELEVLAAYDFDGHPPGRRLDDRDPLAGLRRRARRRRARGQVYACCRYRDVNVVIGLAAVCLGSAARYLGRLAATMGQTEDAADIRAAH